MAFVRSNLTPDIRRANFVIILEWLKGLSDKNDMSLQEACILTLCRLAKCVYSSCRLLINVQAHQYNRVSDDEETNIILLRLLEYLGHPNPYVCAVAYNEVRGLNLMSMGSSINGAHSAPQAVCKSDWYSNSCLNWHSSSR